MKRIKKTTTSFFFLVLLCPVVSYSQGVEFIENDLYNTLKRIDSFAYLSFKTEETAFDSLINENKILKEKLVDYASKNTAMFTYLFTKLKDFDFYKAISPDKKFCIYSWNLKTGGSMQFYENIFVYEQYGKIYTRVSLKEEGTPGGFYTDIFQLTDELNTFYIGNEHRILSGRDCYQAVHIFDFEKEKFDEAFKKIKTKSGLTNTLGFSYNFFSVSNRKERPVKLISYNSKTNTIAIPVVNSQGKVSSKKIFYTYDGDYFVRQTAIK